MNILLLTNNLPVAAPLLVWLQGQGETVTTWDKPLQPMLFACGMVLAKTEIMISYNYKYIIREDVLSLFSNHIINLHISLLPWNRGANPNFWSFIAGTPKGVTIHRVDSGLDTGDILLQKEVAFDEATETFSSSYAKLHEEIQALLRENWYAVKGSNLHATPQTGNGSYHNMKQFLAFTQTYPLDWNENISDYKRKYKLLNEGCM